MPPPQCWGVITQIRLAQTNLEPGNQGLGFDRLDRGLTVIRPTDTRHSPVVSVNQSSTQSGLLSHPALVFGAS